MTGRVTKVAALLTAVAVSASGCGVLQGGLRGVSLPGGANLGDQPYPVQIAFEDVVDLVPQSIVRVGDVPVGAVESVTIEPTSWNALVMVQVNGDVELPANATARVRTTSLLGEKFVELAAPDAPAEGDLAAAGRIDVQATGRAAEVEEVLGALSMLLNGGGVAQIRTIATELNNALSGREPQIRELLDNLDLLVGSLDDSKDDINRALDSVNRLSATLAERRPQIRTALTEISPGLRELEAQREQLVGMLRALDRLSGVATDVVNRSRDDLLADLEALRPVLRNLADSGQDLPESLQLLLSIPFTDAATDAVAGDYANLYITVDLDLKSLLENLLRSNQLGLPLDPTQLAQLPPNAQLLTPLLDGEQPIVPGAPPLPLLGPEQPTPAPAPGTPEGTATTPAPSGSPTATPTPESGSGGGGGLLGGLFGGGS
ncbi:MCE family protein [Pseudonocardia parietis]|uniref:Phospholipid/cholesterol/gamma-HCH transport system substrate-binding protein n=1 Tax=Pseudonocardia parietis TaxID=570936 RepID=A0ABS4VQB4_9PSEU|nr:MCE family protein [Pseudonocardia parietis]MBP2365769.1 phospholipid/cholesterol/gamma-HCH transport system substrate-binding protein [Pseudonocardia parietis]